MKIKLIILASCIIWSFLIYKAAYKENKMLLVIGDGSCSASTLNGLSSVSYNELLFEFLKKSNNYKQYNDDFCYSNYSLKDLVDDIENNTTIKEKSILNLLDKADYITISIGYDELTNYKLVTNNIKKEFLESYSKLLYLVKINTKADVIVIGFYPGFFNQYSEINNNIKQYCYNNEITFVDTSDIYRNKSYFYDYNNYKLNRRGNEKIFNIIKDNL